MDVYVANDGQQNLLWMNQRNGTFKNVGLLSGTALSAHGKAKAGMGVDAGDFDNDGDEDLFVTNLTGEGNDLYVNDGTGLFEEQSARSGLGPASRGVHGIRRRWFDADNDGWLDMLTVNGAVQTHRGAAAGERSVSAASAQAAVPQPRQRTVRGRLGARRRRRSSSRTSAAAPRSATSTTTATSTCWWPTTTARPGCSSTTIGSRNHWVGLRLVGAGDADMLGARVGVVRADGTTLWRRARSDGSYASANDPRVLVGLGQADAVSRASA